MPSVTPQELSPTRYHPRVDAGFMVRLSAGEFTVSATATDLSMAGMKVFGELDVLEERVVVTIPIPGERAVVTAGTVRRHSGNGAAVEFDELDWDDMIALARFVHPRLQ